MSPLDFKNIPTLPGVYKLTNLINGKIYVGKAVNLRKRVSRHKDSVNYSKGTNCILINAFKKYGFENFDLKKDSLFVSGWSILEKVESNNSNIFIVVFDSDSEYVFLTSKINRPDITKVENDSYDYNNSGFMLKADLNEIGKGTYQLGVFILNDKKEGFYITEKEIHLD